MLVDDEFPVIESIRCLLKDAPYQMDIFTDPKEALRRTREQRYDLVISDYLMPEMDGITLVKAIGKIAPETRSIILCGYSQLGAVLRAVKQAEISHYVTKPWNDEGLKEAIARVLDKNNEITSLPCITKEIKKEVLKERENESALAELERKFPGITQGAWEANKPFFNK